MLQLKNITKVYAPGENQVEALKGISLTFRKSDFVSVLGPSGCGKTTLLNIIGGLDRATGGDLVINGKSTKDFGDREWDAYRNHSIGFVFQSYNLIPHQTVLSNVELALTLAGVSKAERRQRAKKALEDVGLGDQMKKKPAEMSGGQMQRVAIARALVNNPDIILADEPTGALDTETSVQVMEILKKISRERLIIMVTHNPELAERYSTRIIKMLDGEVLSDTAPLTESEVQTGEAEDRETAAASKKEKKPSMSFRTAFGLSLKNLFTKKGRTLLTSFAGSIGIIGIALIFAVSQGTTNYINIMQEETLASYPLTIQATTMDLTTLMQSFLGVASENSGRHDRENVYSQAVLYDMMNAMNTADVRENDLRSFKAYLDAERGKGKDESALAKALSGIKYTYDLDLQIYTESVDGRVMKSDSEELLANLIKNNLGMDMSGMLSIAQSSSQNNPMMSMMNSRKLWCEMLSAEDGSLISPVVLNQYDVIFGRWPSAYDEVVLVVDKNNEIDDLTLFAMGLKSEEEINKLFMATMRREEINKEQEKWTYEEITARDFRVVLNSSCYYYDEETGMYADLRTSETGLRYLYNGAIPLKVTGIIRPSEDATSAMLTGSIAYTKALTEKIVAEANGAEAIVRQLENPNVDIFTNLPFAGGTAEKISAQEFRDYVSNLSVGAQAKAYITIKSAVPNEKIEKMLELALKNTSRKDMETMMIQGMVQQMGMSEEKAREYVSAMSDQDLLGYFQQAAKESLSRASKEEEAARLSNIPDAQLAENLLKEMDAYSDEQCAAYYEMIVEYSEATLKDNLKLLGYVDLEEPSTISLYATTFESKNTIEDAIKAYNAGVSELKQIRYTDFAGIMMSSVTKIIDAITYVLIAFVSISLVVSSIMIGVITLISVQERTKEIGILRAIGASKRNVSSMFNAETMIIGFASGFVGVMVTYLLCIPINLIIHALTDISALSAYLPPHVAITLMIISMLLTLVAGIIPSRSAAKKDPVVALRTE